MDQGVLLDVDPGTGPGGRTTITVSYYHTPTSTQTNPFPAPVLYDPFTVHRKRSDGRLAHAHSLVTTGTR